MISSRFFNSYIMLIISIIAISIGISPNRKYANLVGLSVSILPRLVVLYYFNSMLPVYGDYQFIYEIKLFEDFILLSFGLDNLSSFPVLPVVFIPPFRHPYNHKNIFIMYREYILLLFIIEYCLLGLFLATSLPWSPTLSETSTFPSPPTINISGYRKRRNHASYMFVLPTPSGSIFSSSGIVLTHPTCGTTSSIVSRDIEFAWSFQILLWILSPCGLAVKIPVTPAHVWLPEAHVEAPTVGSVTSASSSPKVSPHGFIRILPSMSPKVCSYMTPIIFVIGISSILWSPIIRLRQIDVKKVIAYSSIVHMNIALVGLSSGTVHGIGGRTIPASSHGLISAGLSPPAGFLYDRFGTRNLMYLGGFSKLMPLLSISFFILLLSNASFPGFSSSIGEFFVPIGLMQHSLIFTIILGFLLIFGTIYNIWIYDHIFNGVVNTNIVKFYDLTRVEFAITCPLIVLVTLSGSSPNVSPDKPIFLSQILVIN